MPSSLVQSMMEPLVPSSLVPSSLVQSMMELLVLSSLRQSMMAKQEIFQNYFGDINENDFTLLGAP